MEAVGEHRGAVVHADADGGGGGVGRAAERVGRGGGGARQRWGRRAWEYQYRATKKTIAWTTQDPQLVVDAYVHAVTAVRPRVRYHPGVWSQLSYLTCMLPAGLLDWFLSIPRRVEPVYFAQHTSKTSK